METCVKCGEIYVEVSGGCRSCKAIYDKAYRIKNKKRIDAKIKSYEQKNKEKIAKRKKSYYQANKEVILKRSKCHYQDNKEEIQERHRNYYEGNKEKTAIQSRKYRAANRQKIADYHKNYSKKNKEKISAAGKKYREKNKEKILVKQKKYGADNKEKIALRNKKYREKNQDKLHAKEKIYRKKHREARKIYEKCRRESGEVAKKEKEDQSRTHLDFSTFNHLVPLTYQKAVEEGILFVNCKKCGQMFSPSLKDLKNADQCFKGNQTGESGLYCSIRCKKDCETFAQKKYKRGFKPHNRELQGTWAKAVKERDGYECQRCGSKENLHAHHIEPLAKTYDAWLIENGVTFCRDCHFNYAHKLKGCGNAVECKS